MSRRTPISPAPTAAELEAGLVALRAMFDAPDGWPAVQAINYPNDQDVRSCLTFAPPEAVYAVADTLTSYFGTRGTPESNGSARYATWALQHNDMSKLLVKLIEYDLPVPPRSEVASPALKATFSEAAIQQRINQAPPMRYDGAPCYTDAAVWEPDVAAHLVAVLADSAWDVVPFATKRALATSLWLPGQVYAPFTLVGPDGAAMEYTPANIEGWTAARVYRAGDVTTLPGVMATD